MNLTITEQLTYSTVRIECTYADGTAGTGTGFFFRFKDNVAEGVYLPVVITNKHVIEGALTGKFILTKANENSEPQDKEHFPVDFANFETLWLKHPDPEVDLCVMAMANIRIEAEAKGINLFCCELDNSLLPTREQCDNLSALEEILMVGYPNGLWDHVNNKPILRKGVTATHPKFDYCGKKEFMIDAACFPGSSGSPVFIINEGSYPDRTGALVIGSRIVFLGILYAGPQYTTAGEITVIDVPTTLRPIPTLNMPINLGLIIKSERITELEALFPDPPQK